MTTAELGQGLERRIRVSRLGFVGLGWIGRHRMASVTDSGFARVAALCDASQDVLSSVAAEAPGASVCESLDEMLELELDGIVLATPSAMHAEQSITALQHGLAVFCQKPLARTARECRSVLDAARAADRLLGVDLSYRRVRAFQEVLALARGGDLGPIHAVDLVFHNAYGPDKSWFTDPALSGGGCVIDLGTHLIDLALLALGRPAVTDVDARLYRHGGVLELPADVTEDFALVNLKLATGATVRLACSWFAPAGREAVIELRLFGSQGGAAAGNVAGSFYDFRAERYAGTQTQLLVDPPDSWGGRTILDWVGRLAIDPSYDPSIETYMQVAEVVDSIYGRSS